MKLCVFAGTFNPIHNAHIAMAEYILDNYEFDKILFIPAFYPPHKDFDAKLSMHRYNMVSIAIKNNPKFLISDIEYKMGGKSYTYNTILELYKQYNIYGKISFLIGTDAFKKIETWYKSDKLKNLIDFIVFIRENNNVSFKELEEKGYNYKFAQMDFVNISSTEIRKRTKENKSINTFVPKEIEEYINKYGLYKN